MFRAIPAAGGIALCDSDSKTIDPRHQTSDIRLKRGHGQRLHKDKDLAVSTCLPQAGRNWDSWYILY